MKLINTIQEKARQRWALDRVSPSIILSGGTLLDPSVLTLGFARRFTTDKRADLIFHDLERFKKMLNDPRGRYKSSLSARPTRSMIRVNGVYKGYSALPAILKCGDGAPLWKITENN